MFCLVVRSLKSYIVTWFFLQFSVLWRSWWQRKIEIGLTVDGLYQSPMKITITFIAAIKNRSNNEYHVNLLWDDMRDLIIYLLFFFNTCFLIYHVKFANWLNMSDHLILLLKVNPINFFCWFILICGSSERSVNSWSRGLYYVYWLLLP